MTELSGSMRHTSYSSHQDSLPGCTGTPLRGGHLSPETEAKDALKTLNDAVKDNLATQDCLTKILDAQSRRTYTPNSNGPRDYFKGCEVDARMDKRLGQAIDINTTMLYAQRAFT